MKFRVTVESANKDQLIFEVEANEKWEAELIAIERAHRQASHKYWYKVVKVEEI